ncbi:hypothetical protein CALCODRAFT_510103 [Calocera cornea HHB12733]|uniref:RING-type domain-containing protein n=1 Tax=Calocera cornea HHB12733 TaxID=1353952 RepID=A0A165ETH9_9BASI|nr:hypothetical protein CALCODRAFT_510103 [Calocera cornea HHB12733]
MFGEDDESYLQRREDAQCVACLESDANVKYTNCPKGHPGHMDCIMEWMKAQTEQKLKMTCPACRTPTSPLIKPIKKGASAAKAKPGGKKAGKKGKRDLEEVESEAEAEMRDLDEEHPELGSEA